MGSMTSDRRNPIKPFAPASIRDFLRGREISTVELLAWGRSNTNYKLILAGGEAYVVRIYSHGDGRKETYAMNLVRDLVPAPAEIYRGDSWPDYSFSVFSFLKGDVLQNVPGHSGVAAQTLARISSLAMASPGMIEPDGRISRFSFGRVKGFIAESLGNPKVAAWLGVKEVSSVFEMLKREEWRLAELDSECRMVHGDFNPTNILIDDGAVSGVLDWEFCHSGTPYMDIGNLLRHTAARYHRSIELGLRAGGMDLPRDWRRRAGLVDLTSQLEFLTSARSDAFKRQCVARIRRFTRIQEATA